MRILLLVVVLLAPAARAADAPLWDVGFGAAVLRMPQYRGADRDSTLRLPLPYVSYRGTLLKANHEGVRASLLRWQALELELSASLSPPVDADDNPARTGMPPLAATGELGPDLVWRFGDLGDTGRWSLHWPLRAAVTLQHGIRMVGWTSSPHVQWDHGAAGWRLGLGAGPLWASSAYHGYFYTVAPAFATAERPAYTAHGGMSGWRARASLSRRFGQAWVGAYASADTLAGSSVRASPLVLREQGRSIGVGVAWIFASSSQRVSADD